MPASTFGQLSGYGSGEDGVPGRVRSRYERPGVFADRSYARSVAQALAFRWNLQPTEYGWSGITSCDDFEYATYDARMKIERITPTLLQATHRAGSFRVIADYDHADNGAITLQVKAANTTQNAIEQRQRSIRAIEASKAKKALEAALEEERSRLRRAPSTCTPSLGRAGSLRVARM